MAPTTAQKAIGSKSEIQALLQDIAIQGQKFNQDELEPEAREKLIQNARALISSLETPLESILWMIWSEPTRNIAARLALDLKIFDTMIRDNGRPKSVVELAAPTGASPKLVQRIARKLATMHMIDETGVAEYAPNQLTRTLTIPKYRDGIRFW